MSRITAFQHGCRLEVNDKGAAGPPGQREDPVGEPEIERKYSANVDGILSDAAAEGLREDVMRLEMLADTRRLMSRLVVDG